MIGGAGVIVGLAAVFDIHGTFDNSRIFGMNYKTAAIVFLSTGTAAVAAAVPFLLKSRKYGIRAYELKPPVKKLRLRPGISFREIKFPGKNVYQQAVGCTFDF